MRKCVPKKKDLGYQTGGTAGSRKAYGRRANHKCIASRKSLGIKQNRSEWVIANEIATRQALAKGRGGSAAIGKGETRHKKKGGGEIGK